MHKRLALRFNVQFVPSACRDLTIPQNVLFECAIELTKLKFMSVLLAQVCDFEFSYVVDVSSIFV